jgi:hypothetical protein
LRYHDALSTNQEMPVIARAAIILGLIFAALAAMYWLIPAGSLPAFVPGFEAGSTRIHVKHGVAAAIVAVLLFAVARFYGRRA